MDLHHCCVTAKFVGFSRRYGIDKHAVTNDQFAAFVKATGYVTEAEKFGWSFVLE